MRILVVSIYDVARTGGLSSHLVELSSALRRLGHDVRIVTPHTATPPWMRRLLLDAPRLPMRIVDRDRAYLHFLRESRRLLARGIARLLAADPIEAVHAHDPLAALAASDALAVREAPGSRSPRPRLVLTVHGDIANMAVSDGVARAGGAACRAAERFEADAYRRADALITVDDRLRDHCRRLAGSRAIEVIRNFVDTDRYRPAGADSERAAGEIRRSLGLDAGQEILLVPRRLVKKTGVIHAVRAMGILTARGTTARHRAVMLVAGRGPELAAIKEEADRLGLAGEHGAVRFIGDVPRDRLARLYALARAVLVPSVPDAGVIEATSIAALEAMACARPVVASRIGGLAEIIEHGRTGILVPPGDPEAIAAAAARLLEDLPLARALGAAARRDVETRYSAEASALRVAAIYARPAAGPPAEEPGGSG